jgi:hypothetical protein
MAHSTPKKSHRSSRCRLSILGNSGRDLEFEARMILASLWAPLKSGFASMLRFGLRSDITTTIMDRSPGQTTGGIFPRRRSHKGAGLKPASSSTPVPIYAARRGPKRFLAARHGGE